MRVAWKDEKDSSYGTLGPCFISVRQPHWTDRVFHVSIAIRNEANDEPEWHRFEIPEAEIDYSRTEAKRIAVEKARELGCRRRHTRHEYDEEWLTDLSAVMLEEFERAAARYQHDMDFYEEHGRMYSRPDFTKYGTTTGYFVDLFDADHAGHYLGQDYTRREIRRAVTLILGRLNRAGVIEAEKWDRHRHWYLVTD